MEEFHFDRLQYKIDQHTVMKISNRKSGWESQWLYLQVYYYHQWLDHKLKILQKFIKKQYIFYLLYLTWGDFDFIICIYSATTCNSSPEPI